ncbi:MAG: glycosyltransferase, partial [Bacteroidales bacterium]|nr:glycosyltransferase [Bacteroidales bacterium]
MISVIVPVYNVRPFLTEAIESVIAQSYTDWEMILVDDGSTDGCGEICDTYSSTDS